MLTFTLAYADEIAGKANGDPQEAEQGDESREALFQQILQMSRERCRKVIEKDMQLGFNEILDALMSDANRRMKSLCSGASTVHYPFYASLAVHIADVLKCRPLMPVLKCRPFECRF